MDEVKKAQYLVNLFLLSYVAGPLRVLHSKQSSELLVCFTCTDKAYAATKQLPNCCVATTPRTSWEGIH